MNSAPKKEIFSPKTRPSRSDLTARRFRREIFLFCSGQIALDAESGQVAAQDVEGQTRKVMENIAAVLQAGGSAFDHVVKTTIFLKSMGDFPKVNEIYGILFQGAIRRRARRSKFRAFLRTCLSRSKSSPWSADCI